jgi:glucose-6-phosphate isomerase
MKGKISIPLSGLPATLSPSGISFGKNVCIPEYEVKRYKKFSTFFNSKFDSNKILYYIYRNCCLEKDVSVFKKHGVRYDLTLLAPGKIGNEPVRTIGHLHNALRKIGRPAEIYQVIFGSAIFLFHDINTDHIYTVSRRKGEKIIIPPQCAHITINASLSKPLVVSNIFINNGGHNYDFFKKTHGPAWYPAIKEGDEIYFKKNPRIKRNVALSRKTARPLPFGLNSKTSLYKEFILHTNRFSFLSNPKKYLKDLSIDSLFK